MPYAKTVNVKLETATHQQTKTIKVSEGKILPADGVGTCFFQLATDGKEPVSIHFQAESNIWLNALVVERLVE